MVVSLDRRRFLLGTLGLARAVVLGGCGGGDDDDDGAAVDGTTTTGGTGGATGELTTVNLGLLPITDGPHVPRDGPSTFADQGLEINPTFAAGGATILPSVESGEFDVGYSNIVSLLLLQSRGGRYTILAGGGLTATDDAPDYSQLIVMDDSPFGTVADVSGRTVAINTLRNALEIVVRESVTQAGGDHESINFVEIPFPEMGAALESGEVDAIQYNEPFQTILEQGGTARSIGKPFNVAAGGEILAYYFVKEENIEGPIATGFSAAMAKSNAYAAEHEQELRDIITTYTEVPQEIADLLIMPTYVEESLPESSLKRYAELMTEYGLVDELPAYEDLLPET